MTYPPIQVPPPPAVQEFEVFVMRFFSHYLRNSDGDPVPIPQFHREIYYVLSHPELYQKFMLVAPRGFSKSTLIMLFDTLWDALFTRKYPEILLVGASQSLVRTWIRRIKFELTNNEKLIDAFGFQSTEGQSAEKWSEDVISLKNGVIIEGIGRDGASRGMHPRKVSIDDIEDDESARSDVQCEKIETWLKATLEPMLIEKNATMRWCGTLLTPESVLSKAYKGEGWDDSWFRKGYSAAVNEKGEPSWPGHSIWPERFSDEWLERKAKSVGLLNFLAEYQNLPQFGGNPVIRQDWIRYYKEEDKPEFMYKILAVDPAISEGDQADYTAMACLGADTTPARPSNKIYVIDAVQGKWDINSIVRKIYDMYRAYAPDLIVIESVAYQKALKQVIEREARDWGLFLPVVEVLPDKDKRRRLEAVSSQLEAGNVLFRRSQDELIAQLISFTGKATKKDDLVDAFTYGLQALMNHWHFVDEETAPAKKDLGPAIPILGM